MQSTNPSHILIARNSRSLHHGQASSISSPEVETAAASGVFRSSHSPQWFLDSASSERGFTTYELDFATADDLDADDAIVLDETFTRRAKWPGTVKIIVESNIFWTHKDILHFASPFFEAALSGNWSETGRPLSMSSVITISQPPIIPASNVSNVEPSEGITFAPAPESDDEDGDDHDNDSLSSENGTENQAKAETDKNVDENVFAMGKADSIEGGSDPVSPSSAVDEKCIEEEEKKRARVGSLEKLQGKGRGKTNNEAVMENAKGKERERLSLQAIRIQHKRHSSRPEAIIVLKEEKASTFHDFLKFVYPHLDCTITWNNVEGLMNISHKLVVPSLQRACLDFLLTHAAGKPIKAMRIAELFEEEELYRESSRFVLDNPGGWSDTEIATLSQETLLKLEKRRNWFLERVLKLGITNIAKEYQCCSTCPDTATCAKLLEEKWKQAYHACFRIGPPQPSMVYRYLRTLEGISPPLSLTQLTCQTTAKSFIATLFDRMFSLGVRGSGTDTAPPPGVRGGAAAAGPRRHFLYCSLKGEQPPPPKLRRSRDLI